MDFSVFVHTVLFQLSLSQLLNEGAEPLHFLRNTYILGAMFLVYASTALYAMVRLAFALHSPVKANEESAPVLAILRVACILWQASVNLYFIIMCEDGGYVYSVWTRHAVLARIAGYSLLLHHLVGNGGVQQVLFFFREWY